MVGRHHLEALAEVGEACAQVHLGLELLKDLVVIEVSVGEQAVQSAHDVVQVLLGVCWDRHSVEVIGVDDSCCVVQRVDHVVDGGAVAGALVRSADEDELLVARHLGARLACADSKQLHHKEVELEDELADVFVLPYALVDFGRQLANFHDVGGLVPDQLLEELLHGEGPRHLGDVFHAPAPQVARLRPRSVPPPQQGR